MARVPEGARADRESAMSGAPGIRVGNMFMMAGVPHIAAQMLDALTGTLEGGRPVVSRTIGCWVPESEVAELLGETERAHATADRQLSLLQRRPGGANFVIRSPDEGALEACLADLVARLEAAGRTVVAEGI